MIKELFPGLDENELLELWPTYEVDEKKVEKLTTTNISHANIALNSILDDLEKVQLEKLFLQIMDGTRLSIRMEWYNLSWQLCH